MNCLLILNPRSRSAADARAEVLARLRREVRLIGEGPQPPERLAEILRETGSERIGRIIVAGGDGTLNACLRDLMDSGLAVGLLPLGTANDCARNLGVPSDPAAAIDVALHGRVHPVDVALVNGKPFVNAATIGLGPKVTKHLTTELKARLGFLSYPRALLSAYRESRPFRTLVRGQEGQELRLRCLHLAVGNGRYYGGGAVVGDTARLDEGVLHVSALRPTPLWRLFLQAPLIALGRHRSAPDAVAFESCQVSVETSHAKQVSADGEILAETPARFEVIPGALRIVVPAENPGPGVRAP